MKENGLEDSVMTIEELRTGTESRGTGILFLPFKARKYCKLLRESLLNPG